MTAIEKSAGKTRAMAASSLTRRVRWRSSTNATVSTPVAVAAPTSNGEVISSAMKNPSTMPSRIECEIASLTSAIRRSTRKTPGSAQLTATTTARSWISMSAVVTVPARPPVPRPLRNSPGTSPGHVPLPLS